MPGDAPAAVAADGTTAPAGLQADAALVTEIVEMGLDISENAAKRSLIKTMNAGTENAVAWYFDHIEDADINDPL